MQCVQCQEETKNPKFCSRSCAATHNNKKFPKRDSKKISCKNCNKLFRKSLRSQYCSDACRPLPSSEKTLEEMLDYSKCHRSTLHSRIREAARRIAKKLDMNSCLECHYSLHVEICHIKAINSFSLNAKLKEINHPDNLAPYCRNHHWELDNGYL